MDPLSALSVAGTIVQFVDFGSKLLKEGRGFYNSPSGALASNQELEIITTALQSVVTKLRQSIGSSEVSALLTDAEHEHQLSFYQICDGAATVAEEPLAKLKGLKVQGKRRKWDSLQKAVKSMWSKQEVEDLVKRLSTFKEALNTQLLSSLW
jgi:hypothetical protein